MPAKKKAQIGFEDKIVEDEELLEALESWNEKKVEKAEVEAEMKKRRTVVDGFLGKYALEPGEALRCGSFVVTVRDVDEAEVSFTRGAKEQVDIRLAAVE